MVEITYEDYQDLARKLSLANERVEWRDDRIEALEAELVAVKAERDRQYDENINRVAAEGAAISRAETAESRLSEMEKEVERLRAWKAEATELLDEFCAVSGVWLDPRNDDVHRRARRLVEGDGK